MKTLKQLALFLLIGSSAILTSCGPDDEVAPENKPTITIASDSKTAKPGETVRLTINAAAEKQLRNIKVSVSAGGSNAGTIMDTTFASGRNTSGAITYDYLVGNAANYTFTATVTDRDGITATATETVTVSGTASDFQLCPGVTLGSYNNTSTGSSFNSANCAVLKAADARNAAADVDFIYFFGASNGATLAAPSDASFGTGASQIDFGVHTWTPRNPTKLKVLSGFNFDDATAANIQTALGTGDSKANNLKVGDIVGFATADGKYGVARVNAISGGTAGTIVLDVKTSK